MQPDDLTARARQRAEELKQAASGIPATPYEFRSWEHDDWGIVRNSQGPVANTATQSIISRWRAAVYDKIEGDPRPAWEAGPPETQALGEFLVHAANTATDQVTLLRSLADRVDEQERRIKELEGEKKRLQLEVLDTQGRFISFQNQVSVMAAQIAEALSQKGGG